MRLLGRFSNNVDFDTFLVVHQWTSALYERQNASFLMTKRWGRKWLLSFRRKKDWDAGCLLSYSIKSSFPPDRRLAPLPLQVVKGFNQKKRFWNWHAKMHSVQFLLLAVSKGEAEPSANRNTDTVLLYSKINGADENSLCNRLYA